jgi:hypothetical protein
MFSKKIVCWGYWKSFPCSSIGWELPGHVPFEATEKLILNITNRWEEPSIECFNDIFAICSDFLKTLTAQHFGQFKLLEKHVMLVRPQPTLFPGWLIKVYENRSIIRTEIKMCKTETLRTLGKILELEKTPMFTQNTDFLTAETNKWLSIYINPSVDVSYHHLPTVNSNTVDDAILVMAKVHAYFQVAHKVSPGLWLISDGWLTGLQRIVDYVPLTIEHELNQALSLSLPKTLLDSLFGGLDAAKRVQALMKEDPGIASQRTFLEEKKLQLLQIKDRLDSFRDGSESSADEHSELLEEC